MAVEIQKNSQILGHPSRSIPIQEKFVPLTLHEAVGRPHARTQNFEFFRRICEISFRAKFAHLLQSTGQSHRFQVSETIYGRQDFCVIGTICFQIIPNESASGQRVDESVNSTVRCTPYIRSMPTCNSSLVHFSLGSCTCRER